jgi:hypothetical protein
MRRTESFAQSIPSAHLDAYRFLAEELVRLHGSLVHRLFSALTRARYRGTELPRAFSLWRKRAPYLEKWDELPTEHKRQLLQASLEYGLYLQNSHLFYLLGRVLRNGRLFPDGTDRLLSTFNSHTKIDAVAPFRGSFYLLGETDQKAMVVSDLANWFELLGLSFQFITYSSQKSDLKAESPHLHFRTIAPWQAALLRSAPATVTFMTSGTRVEAAERRGLSQDLLERTRSDFVLIWPDGATLDYTTWRAKLTRLWYGWSAERSSQRLARVSLSRELARSPEPEAMTS